MMVWLMVIGVSLPASRLVFRLAAEAGTTVLLETERRDFRIFRQATVGCWDLDILDDLSIAISGRDGYYRP